ncbi:GTP-binding protein [Thermococcus celer]|uniref:GTP-binding protein n=1 Tax=Thermococcus celer Vu 13 = JCM 8558 TaxID=1293037 RepID=A0A218P2B6_THECE|nr:GTP-binding protein [Thermococcus celer]ASI99054.1 GTP-binding protein [Thermococcus celer Vu 13 = JCM 8558]
MTRRVKLGHHYYYIVTVDELNSGGFRGKNVVIEGVVEDKPLVEFLPMELPGYRTTFQVSGFRVEFSGSPCIGKGDRVRVYGRFLGDCIMASAIETERAVYTTEE